MKNILLLSAFVMSNIFGATAFAGPFGLKMGMPLEQIDAKAKQLAPGKYQITNVPKPHSAFESYVVQVAPKAGLCWIKAIGKDITTSSYGVELKSAFYDMKEKLDKAYGNSKTTDRLLPGSIWHESNEWMMGLIKKERFLFAIWEKETGAKLKNNIITITMAAKPSARSKGYIGVDYSFSNEEECNKEIESQEDGAL